MKRQQKRYKTEAEILKAIDDAHKQARDLSARANQLECEAERDAIECSKEFERSQDRSLTERERQDAENIARGLKMRSKDAKDKAERLYKRAARIADVRLKKLGRTLAAFRTEPMADILGSDIGVVAAR